MSGTQRALRMVGGTALAILVTLTLGCEAPSSGPTTAAPRGKVVGSGPKLEGRIMVGGSSTVHPITREAKLRYTPLHDGVDVIVSIEGTKGGFARYLSGDLDLVNASRPATVDEESKANARGLGWTQLAVGYDGITVVVNSTNTFVKSLSVPQLKRLFEPESTVKSWRDLDPAWPDCAIHLYVPDEKSGTFDFFTETIVGRLDAQRKDVKTSEDDGTLVKDVAGDPDGLGYFGFAYYNANKDDVRAVPIRPSDNAEPVMPLLETLLARKYVPLGRPLFIYVKIKSVERPEVASFIDYYMSNVEEFATLAGYVPPSADDLKSNARALEALRQRSAGRAANVNGETTP